MRLLLFLVTFLVSVNIGWTQDPKKSSPSLRYSKTSSGYIMVLRQGDDVFSHLEDFARRERIKGATFTGLGFVNVKFGFFDQKKKTYEPKEFKSVELASFTGSLAWQEDKPSIHAHGVVTDRSFKAYGGHILEAQVDTGSLEIHITTINRRLERNYDKALGANVLEVP